MGHMFESGFCVRRPSWHGEETLIADYPGDWDEARRLAGLTWDPVATPVYAAAGVNDDGSARYAEIPGFRRVARSDTAVTLGVMSDSYQVIDHGSMGAIVEALLEQTNVRWDTAGSLDGGRQVYACAYLDEPIVIPGDFSLTFPYLTVLNRHDGRGACKVTPTTVRVVCANTFAAAEAQGDRNRSTFAFVHAGCWRERLDEARQAVTGVRREAMAWVAIATELATIAVSDAQRQAFIAEFIPMPPGQVVSDRVVRNINQARQRMTLLFDSPTVAPIAHSAYGLVQAAGEYLDHLRPYRSADTYLGRQLLTAQALKTRAVTLARHATDN